MRDGADGSSGRVYARGYTGIYARVRTREYDRINTSICACLRSI